MSGRFVLTPFHDETAPRRPTLGPVVALDGEGGIPLVRRTMDTPDGPGVCAVCGESVCECV